MSWIRILKHNKIFTNKIFKVRGAAVAGCHSKCDVFLSLNNNVFEHK